MTPTPPSGHLPVLAAAVLWGTTGTAASFAPAGAPVVATGSAGLVLGGLLMLLTSRPARRLPARSGPADRRLLVLGAVAVACYPVAFYPAVARTGVAVATVIALGSAPVFAGLLTRTRPTARWAVATTAAVLGCALLVLGPDAGRVDGLGVLLAVLAGLSYAAYSVIGGGLIARGHPSGAVMAVLFAGGAVLVLPVVVVAGAGWLADPRGAAVALYLALFTVYLAYRLFGYGLRRTDAQTATTLTLAEPAVAAVLGVVVLRERLPASSWVGLGVLALGLLVLATAPRAPGGPSRWAPRRRSRRPG